MIHRQGQSPAKERFVKRRGFTLLEVLVVVGIIAILSTLLVIGIGKLQTSSRRQQTTLMLENLRAMYADYDSIVRRHFPSYNNLNPPVNYNVDIGAPQNVSTEFYNSNAGLGTSTVSADRYGSDVCFTRDIMGQIRSIPTNASALGKLSSQSLMTLTGSIAPTPFATGTTVTMLERVSTPDPVTPTVTDYYTSIQYNYNGAVAPPDSGFWINSVTDSSVPVLLDAWGNPIIFVSGGSLGTGALLVTDVSNPAGPKIVGKGTGAILAGGIGLDGISATVKVRSPDGRPFFASAGPDGDFSLGDDNLYSFDK